MSGPGERSIVIPDLHGSFQYLEWVAEEFPDRHYIFLGDLIHRGPDSRRCLQTALQWAEDGRAVLLWGNHEDWVVKDGLSLDGAARDAWFSSNEAEMLSEYRAAGEGLPELIRDVGRFARLAKHFWIEREVLYAHAARPSFGATLDDIFDDGHMQNIPVMGLHPLPTEHFPALEYSVHGHAVIAEPWVEIESEGAVYLDLGSFTTGRFCVWDAETRRVILYPDSYQEFP